MIKLKAILFDLDGTLRDTKEIMYTALEETLAIHNGQKPSREELAPHIHHHSAAHRALSPHVEYEPWLVTYREKLGDSWMDAPFYAGTEELLTGLQAAGYRLAIVTSAEYDRTKEYLRYRELDGYFDAVAAMREGVKPKPEPDLIHDALTQLGCKPSEAMMVGDMTTDVEAARAAGLPCIGITHGFASRQELKRAGASDVIDALAELPDALVRL